VTSNKAKFDEACIILDLADLEANGIEIIHTPLELDELQGSSYDITRHKILQAYDILTAPCLIDDTSLFCRALGGLPGPYIRSFLEALGAEGLAKLISHYDDHSCHVMCHTAFAKDAHEPLFFEGIRHGTIVLPRGSRVPHAINWNAIFVPEGHTRTFAEMSLDEMSQISARSIALTNFRNYLLAK
jgi:inosine triphosphate pyrophosphatase